MKRPDTMDHSLYTKRGFTLVELMVVTLIIGILASLSIVASFGAKKSARDGRRKADLEQIRSALEMCKADTESYPASVTFGGQLICDSDVYMEEVPSDPGSYSYYYNFISANQYELCGYLETGGSDDCGNNCSAPENCNYKVTNP